jgi:NAD(P)-dependent dehydrogenase (short-subunit alcohol dehydrogenase family)
MNFGLEGKNVLVVGGTSGIGAGIAYAFAEQGSVVTVTGATPAEISAARTSESMAGIECVQLDVRELQDIEKVLAGFDKLDVLVNCAGVIRRATEHDPSVFADVIDINLNGTMRTCACARALLKANKGSIINTASMLSFFGGGQVPAYSASKGGIAQLTKSLAIAYAEDGIRVNAVAPGWIATPLTQALQQDSVRSRQILDRTPMKRWGMPADVAKPVLFLASSAADFITGTILPVDGGYLIG